MYILYTGKSRSYWLKNLLETLEIQRVRIQSKSETKLMDRKYSCGYPFSMHDNECHGLVVLISNALIVFLTTSSARVSTIKTNKS